MTLCLRETRHGVENYISFNATRADDLVSQGDEALYLYKTTCTPSMVPMTLCFREARH